MIEVCMEIRERGKELGQVTNQSTEDLVDQT